MTVQRDRMAARIARFKTCESPEFKTYAAAKLNKIPKRKMDDSKKPVIEEKKLTTTFKVAVITLIALITWSVTGGIFYANLKNDIEGKADKGEFEKFKIADSINTRTLFIQQSEMKEDLKDIDNKFDRLLEKNNIRVPEGVSKNDK